MLDFLLFLLTAWAAIAAGRMILRALGTPEAMTGLARNLFGFAIGLGVLAYGMLGLGLLGGLYPLSGWLLLGFLGVVGAGSHVPMAQELQTAIRRGVHLSLWGWALAVFFVFLAATALVGVYTPPTLNLEWDSLAYHLADPKLYLQAHRIYYLPWENHSNFAFTGEMWYLYALLIHGTENGVPLAKLFHFSCGIGASLAIYAFGSRHLTPKIGQIATLLYASTPLVLWEAGTAYVDLAPTFFTMLTLLAVGNGIVDRDERWLRLGAILMGLTLSTKATSLSTLALLAFGLLYWRLRVLWEFPKAGISAVAVWCLIALAVGSPWYVKSAVYTGNPVYPFFYHEFGGRFWNAELGRQYSHLQANFGVGNSPEDAHSPPQALLLPWNLTMYLLPGHPYKLPLQPYNDYQTPLGSLSPVLLAVLFFPAFRKGKAVPGVIKTLSLYALLSTLFWFANMQYARYLLPQVPIFCLLAATVYVKATSSRAISGHALSALGICSLAFTVYVCIILLTLELPVAFGLQSRAAYLTLHEPTYPAMTYINTALPPDSKIAFYGNPLGFYCDRPYLWAEGQYSTYIPYAKFQSADDLKAYLSKMGVTHILVNSRYFPLNVSAADNSTRWVSELTEGAGPPLFEANGIAVFTLK